MEEEGGTSGLAKDDGKNLAKQEKGGNQPCQETISFAGGVMVVPFTVRCDYTSLFC